MKLAAAVCPLCHANIVLGPAHEFRAIGADEAAVQAHMATHSTLEFIQCIQGLRRELIDTQGLRNTPHWAMPQA